MARYRVLAWRDIPTQVQVTDDAGTTVSRPMAKWFMQEVSRITMREGLAGTDDYLEAFAWSAWTEWPAPGDVGAAGGDAEAVADAVVETLAERLGRAADGHTLREV